MTRGCGKVGAVPAAFTVRTHQIAGGVVEVEVVGEVDVGNALQLRAAILSALDDRPTALQVHLAGVDFIDSTGLGALVAGRNRAEAHHTAYTICHLQDSVLKVVRITGLLDVLGWNQTTSPPVQ